MKISDLKIGTRLTGSFGIVLTLMLCITGLGVMSMTAMQSRMETISDVNNISLTWP